MTAQEFMAMGAGNGFPFCLTDDYLNQSGKSDWDEAELPGSNNHEKFINATHLFWNLKSIDVFNVESYLTSDPSIEFSFGEWVPVSYEGLGDDSLEDFEPYKRVCLAGLLSHSFRYQFYVQVLPDYPEWEQGTFRFQIAKNDSGDLAFFYKIDSDTFSNPAFASDGTSLGTIDMQVGLGTSDTVTLNIAQNRAIYPVTVTSTNCEVEFWTY